MNGYHFAGTITMHDIHTAMPWGNTIDVVTITGHTLKLVLEHSVKRYKTNDPDPSGRFLQVSGLTLTYDISKPVGHRLVSGYTGHGDSLMAIQDEAYYQISMPSYLAHGGDNFKMIPDQTISYKNTGFLDNDLLVKYLRKKNPLKLPIANRIVVNGNNSGGFTCGVSGQLYDKNSNQFVKIFKMFDSFLCFLMYTFG